ncbi:hypothetical protein E2C01_027484 [Portunus trituberculatus]|uniref:Uncharacterized protein n=1 Tax=Portunus trituberculatus TaxID=210409 RepID=A0A5B7EKY9_PORTR|nr:hypothetical protein [Portunus trituberculatus]
MTHHQLWLSSPFNDYLDELAFNFAILHEQLVQHPTHIPDRLGDMPNILGSPKAEVPLVFCFCQLGVPEKVPPTGGDGSETHLGMLNA